MRSECPWLDAALDVGMQTGTVQCLPCTPLPLSYAITLSLCQALCSISLLARRAGRQLLKELGEAVKMLNHERSTRCVVVRSSLPGVFCAGADLKVRSCLPCFTKTLDTRSPPSKDCVTRRVSGVTAWPALTGGAGCWQERAAMTQVEAADFVSQLRSSFSALEVAHPPG